MANEYIAVDDVTACFEIMRNDMVGPSKTEREVKKAHKGSSDEELTDEPGILTR